MSAKIQVHVQPRAARNEITGFDDVGRLRLRVSAPPADGAANEAVLRLLADVLGLRRRQVTLIRGASSRTKLIEIEGLDDAELKRRLAAI